MLAWGRSLGRVLIVRSGNGVGTFDSDRKQPGIKLQMRLPSLFQVALWTKDKWLFVFIVIHLTLQTAMKLEIAISREKLLFRESFLSKSILEYKTQSEIEFPRNHFPNLYEPLTFSPVSMC